MRLVAPPVLVAAFLVPSGAAKEPVSGSVCGVDGCVVLAEPGTVHQALRWEGTFELVRAPRPAAFYRLTFFTSGPEGFRWTALYVPGRRLLRVDERGAVPPEFGHAGRPYWRTVGRRQVRMLARLTVGVAPFPARARW
jgi:hypothetical protein